MLHAHPEAPDSFCFEPAEFPQPSHSMASARNPPPPGLSPEFHRAVLLPGLLMKLTQEEKEPLLLPRPCTGRPIAPGIVATTAYAQDCAEPCDPIVRRLSPAERVPHRDSLAKHAAAFCKLSRSPVTCATSRRRRASSAAGSACRPEPGNAPPCPAMAFYHL